MSMNVMKVMVVVVTNCTNTEGSFECFCRDGYILVSDGKNCSGARVVSTLL